MGGGWRYSTVVYAHAVPASVCFPSLAYRTMFGLARLLTRASTFDEAMNLAETGDAHNVNQLVRGTRELCVHSMLAVSTMEPQLMLLLSSLHTSPQTFTEATTRSLACLAR